MLVTLEVTFTAGVRHCTAIFLPREPLTFVTSLVAISHPQDERRLGTEHLNILKCTKIEYIQFNHLEKCIDID